MAEEFSGISFPKSPLLPHGKAHGLVATELLSGDGQLCKALTGAHSALPPWPNRCSLNRGSPLLFRNLKSAVPGAPVQPCPDIQLEISFTLQHYSSLPHFLRPLLQRQILEYGFPHHPQIKRTLTPTRVNSFLKIGA